jgi:putative (di)nucleoside polyphosphate hydrolase
MELRYRKNAAAVIVNSRGLLLACKRADKFKSWQLPQGGIDQGETAEQAVLREVAEEIGLNECQVLDSLEQPIRYQWPPEIRRDGFSGQEQYYFLLKCEDEACFKLDNLNPPEFEQVTWMSSEEFYARLSGFKEAAYRKAISTFKKRNPALIS